jgi:hypothetical protein
LWNVRLVSLSTPPSSVTSGQGNAVWWATPSDHNASAVWLAWLGTGVALYSPSALRDERPGHSAYVNWMEPERPRLLMVFAAAHAGSDFDWAVFVVGHLRWQDLAEERHEGAGVLIGLSGEVLLAADIGERIQDHRPQVCAELVGCAGWGW